MSSETETYKNVMETFVLEEITSQLENIKDYNKKAEYIKPSEVATFALNRLPCYYASCTEGIHRQQVRIKTNRELQKKIRSVVSQALSAIEKDPLRQSTPINNQYKDRLEEAKENIPKLAEIVPEPELKWIVYFMETFLTNLKNEQVSQQEVIRLYYLLYYYWEDSQ